MNIPAELRYSSDHEWVRVDGDVATIGITDFAVEHLGDLVFVDLPEAGRELELGESCAEVESVKAVGEVYSPVAGEVLESNEPLADDQALLTSDPFGEGWLFKLKVVDESEVDNLLDPESYEELCPND